VTIADISPDILQGPYDQRLRDELRGQLDELGVELKLGSGLRALPSVAAATPGAIELTTDSGERLSADIWYRTFGVTPHSEYLRAAPAGTLDDAGYIRVDEHLRVAGQDRVFALGDIADMDRDMAAIAGAQATVVVANVQAMLGGAELTAYERFPAAIAIPLGPEGGAGQLPGQDEIAGRELISELKGRALGIDSFGSLFDAAPAAA
jgi:NADH dehydrogenase FAD-containing subunit